MANHLEGLEGKGVRIGVFLCECGGNISDVIDLKEVKREILEGDITHVEIDRYLCSKPGMDLITSSIKRKGLNRIVIAACTPKLHQEFFNRGVEEAGLNSHLLERVNIREQCSWIHPRDPKGATGKAIDLILGGIASISLATPLRPILRQVSRSVLVIGGGIAGISASLRLANYGLQVYLVEESPSLGGNAIKFAKVFPTLDCAQCILTPKMVEAASHPDIKIYTYAEVEGVTGSPGDYHVMVGLKPRGVDINKCIGCDLCSQICPVEVDSEYNEGLGKRKAIYIPFPQAIPSIYTLDFEDCIRCGKCVEKCPRDAIDLEDQGETLEVDVGAILVSTGYRLHDLEEFGEFHKDHPDIITSLQLERMMDVSGPTHGRIIRPSDGGKVERIAFILCAGSRDVNRGVPYCSRVCCLYAIKQARMLKEHFHIDPWIHYIDIRTPGRRYEEFYLAAQEEDIHFVRGMVSKILPEGGRVVVYGVDTLTGEPVRNEVDLAILCPPIIPSPGLQHLADLLKIPLGDDGFILEKHPKLDPVSSQRDGVYGAGMALGPKDIQSTISEAWASASKIMEFLGRGVVEIDPNRAYLKGVEACDGCGECVALCPMGAITLHEGVASIDEMACNGCGACIPTCDKGALVLRTLREEQLMARVEAVLSKPIDGPRILVFLEEAIAYAAADTAGVNRLQSPSVTRFIPVPSTSILRLEHLLHAYRKGADGILLAEAPEEGPLGGAHRIAEERARRYKRELRSHGINPLRFMFTKVYAPNWAKFVQTLETFSEIVASLRERAKLRGGGKKG